MLNKRSEVLFETCSFSSFIDSWEEMSAFSTYTQSTDNDPWRYVDNVEYSKLIPLMKIAHSMSTKLTIVYLVAIAEAYFKDVLTELLDRRVREINQLLMGNPVPSNEEEGIIIEIELAQAEDDRENSFHIFSKTTRDYINTKTRQNTLTESLALLKSMFRIEIKDKNMHVSKWNELKKLRNNIIHHKAYSKEKFLFAEANQGHTIKDISISPDTLRQALYDVFELAYAIESGICKSLSISNPRRLLL
jgi:hypothetical protein